MTDAFKSEVIAKAKATHEAAKKTTKDIIDVVKNHKGDDKTLEEAIIRLVGEYGQTHYTIATK